MEDWPLEVISLDDLADELLSREIIAAIDQVFLEPEEVSDEEEQHDRLTLMASKPLALSRWHPEPPPGKTNGHKKRD